METVLSLNCKGCDKPYEINVTENDFGVFAVNEKQAGDEIKYSYLYMSECECGNVIWVQIDVSEYPKGMLNNYELTYDRINNLESDDNFMRVISAVCR